ncbi:MAG: DUF1573 domain-containing protein [Flavobacteriaceae bacterium]|nr:DUF1573 domain-containing protein [Flavobacteriaceae bacterium]
MKKILLILFVGLLTISVKAQTEEQIKKDFTGPVFEFESEVIDYGEIAQNSDGNRVFTFKNIGKSPLIITQVKGSCGCTVPTKPEEPIMPGETGEIKVKYATNRIGPFSKTITITSNAFESKKVLRVKGRVLETKSEDLTKKKSIVSEK